MDYLGQIENFIADVDACRNIEEVFSGLRRHIERLGFERFTYEVSWIGEGSKRRPLYVSSYPADWVNHYVENKYAADDILCRYTAQVIRPFAWPEITRHPNLTVPQRLILNEGSEAGLRAGGMVPIHGPGAVKAYLAVANNMADEEFIKLFTARRHELHLIATYAHERVLSFGMQDAPVESVRLTPREIEIMTWTAHGKTRWEISKVLTISEETVKVHIENVCRKLNASNKTHATAVALIHGLIAP